MISLDEIAKNLPAVFCGVFVAILLLQSGLDKVLDWSGNLGWLTGHFSKTPLAAMVPMMLGTITVLELVTGLLAVAGLAAFMISGATNILFYSSIAGAASITALFFGQRIAKDYAGAAVLVPYFLLVIVMMYITRPA